jgi:hypothetical protein
MSDNIDNMKPADQSVKPTDQAVKPTDQAGGHVSGDHVVDYGWRTIPGDEQSEEGVVDIPVIPRRGGEYFYSN